MSCVPVDAKLGLDAKIPVDAEIDVGALNKKVEQEVSAGDDSLILQLSAGGGVSTGLFGLLLSYYRRKGIERLVSAIELTHDDEGAVTSIKRRVARSKDRVERWAIAPAVKRMT